MAGQHHAGSAFQQVRLSQWQQESGGFPPFLFAFLALTLHHNVDRALTLADEESPGAGVESSTECSVQPLLHLNSVYRVTGGLGSSVRQC